MTRHCPAVDEFGFEVSRVIERLTGECIYGNRAAFSWSLGWLSLICWIQAQLPQVLLNLQRQSTNGISPGFLVNWLIGDITNLVGCILTRQLPFQTLLATYYCIVDACLVLQYISYEVWGRRRSMARAAAASEQVLIIDGIEAMQSPRSSTPSSRPFSKIRGSISSLLKSGALLPAASAHVLRSADIAQRHTVPGLGIDAETLGLIAAWTSSVFYFTSRIPQIRLNYQRRSTEGVSVYLFMAAFLGNLCYATSILTSPYASTEYGQAPDEIRAFLIAALPFLIGSSGTLLFDATIGLQWLIYRQRANSSGDDDDGEDKIGRGRSFGTFASVDWVSHTPTTAVSSSPTTTTTAAVSPGGHVAAIDERTALLATAPHYNHNATSSGGSGRAGQTHLDDFFPIATTTNNNNITS